jgi:hypothetical protein
MATPTNISSLISPDIVKNIKSSENIKAFGDQIKDKAKEKIKTAATQSTISKLYQEKAALIKEGIEAEITHASVLLNLEIKKTPGKKIENGRTVETPPQISEEEYQLLVANENINYAAFQENLQKRKDENQEAIDKFLKDPFAEIKKKKKERQERIKKLKSRSKEEKRKARRDKRKAVIQNAKKTLVPILTLLLTDRIADIISQNDTIKRLVDNTNRIITEANQSGDPVKLNNAKVVRDSALRVIQDNESKITKINEQLQRVTIYINIFSTIISVLSAIPTPTSVPPGVGIPLNVITKIVQLLEKANKIVLALSALLPTITVSLDKAIQILQDYKAQLLNINNTLDSVAPATPVTLGTDYGTYKGFKFALREDKQFSARETKRHFAVAINRQNIEQLKSEASFTLDPNDLIEQLKLIIDRQNLQG